MAALYEPWYHHGERWRSDSSELVWGEEETFYLDRYTRWFGSSSDLREFTYHESTYFWEPLEPIHSFMGNIEMLTKLGVVTTLSVVALALLRLPRAEIIACCAALGILASVPLVFFVGFVPTYNEVDFPFTEPLSSFMGDETVSGLREEHTVWGPLGGWWLLILAFALQSVCLILSIRLRKV